MSEERLHQLETITQEHSQDIRGINVALNEITETMKAFARGIVDLQRGQAQLMENQQQFAENQQRLSENQQRLSENQQNLTESHQLLLESQRSLSGTVDRLSNTVEQLAITVENVSHTVETNAIQQSEEMATLTAAIERFDRIIDYLMRRDGERDNSSD